MRVRGTEKLTGKQPLLFYSDPCASNPCTNAESCVNDSHLGYRCQNCHSQYTGPKCEEREIKLNFYENITKLHGGVVS